MISRVTEWRLEGTLTREELKWLRNNNCQISVSPVESIDLHYHGHTFQTVGARSYITIWSNSEEMDTLLRLKYTDKIVNIKQEWTMDTGECTLSEVKINAEAW